MLDAGPCRTCPRAAGILVTPTGLTHTCTPEEWRVCTVPLEQNRHCHGQEPQSRNHHREWPLARKTRCRPTISALISAPHED